MIQFLNDIEKANQDAELSVGNDFIKHLKIMEVNRITRQIYEDDIDSIIKMSQDLELQCVNAKICGDLDPSVNGDFMLD